MLLPRVVLAIGASIAGASLVSRYGLKRLYLLGLIANLAAMLLLLVARPSCPIRLSRTRSGQRSDDRSLPRDSPSMTRLDAPLAPRPKKRGRHGVGHD
jgi:hypothetical protein